MSEPDVVTLLKSLCVLAVQGALFVFAVVMTIMHRRKLGEHGRIALRVGIALLILALPGVILTLVRFDVSRLLSETSGQLLSQDSLHLLVYGGLIVGSIGVLLLRSAWGGILYCVAGAEWESAGGRPFPLLERKGNVPWRGIFYAGAFGVAGATISALVLIALGIQESAEVQRLREMFSPAGGSGNDLLGITTVLLAASAIAVMEELMYRGVLLGFLLRGRGGRRLGIVLAVVFVSVLWASGHIFNTDAPFIKCTQIFIFGLFLCEFARRYSLEAAIVSHVLWNITAIIIMTSVA